MPTKTCFKCKTEFEIKRKTVPLCLSCRELLNVVKQRTRNIERRESIAILLNNVLPQLPVELHPLARKLAPAFVDKRYDLPAVELDDFLTAKLEYTADRQPDGTKSIHGSDDGMTAEFAQVEIQQKIDESDNHSWWDENPPQDVFFLFDEPDLLERFMSEPIEDRN